MPTDTDPENETGSDEKLNHEYSFRLYPRGWDLSGLCGSQRAAKPARPLPEEEAAGLDDTKSETGGNESFPNNLAPRIYQFPHGYFMNDETSEPF